MPQGVEQQHPGGEARTPAARVGEQRFNSVGPADLGNAGLGRHQGAEPGALAGDPVGHRHGEAALSGKPPGPGLAFGEPVAQQPLAPAVAQLEPVGQAEGDRRHRRVEQRRAALDAMGHEAAVELGQQVVGQPVGAIDGLDHLQRAAAIAVLDGLGRGDAVAPADRLVAQHAEAVEDTAPAERLAAAPPGPDRAAIAAIAGEQLVATLAGQHHLQLARRRRRQLVGRQRRIVGHRVVEAGRHLGQQRPEIGLAELDLDMLGAEPAGHGAGLLALIVGGAGVGEAHGVRPHRMPVEPRHHGQQRGAVDAARQEHAVGHVGALVDGDAVLERRVETTLGVGLVAGLGAAVGQGGAAQALDDAALGDDQRLAGQHPLDAFEDGLAARGELELEEGVARPRIDPWRRQAGGEQRLGFGGEGQATGGLEVIQRLDAERVAGQQQALGGRVVERDGVHAAQALGEARAVAAVEMQRHLAVGLGGEIDPRQGLALLDVVVDFGVGHQRRAAGLAQRLIAGLEVDDRQAALDHGEAAGLEAPRAVGTAVRQRRVEGVEQGVARRRAVGAHVARDATHQAATVAKKSR